MVTGDEKRRRDERAGSQGDEAAAERAGRDAARHGLGLVGWLNQFIDQWIYVEGIKMNYRGVLKTVMTNGRGDPSGLICEPLVRVGEWQDDPEPNYEELMEGERCIPWETVTDIGLMQSHWAKTTPSKGRRSR